MLMRALRLLQPFEISREHLEIGQQIMRPKHCLRAPQMRVPGDQRRPDISRPAPAARPADRRPAKKRIGCCAQVQPYVERNLLVAAAARVDLARERAHLLLQLPDDEGVNVFIVGAFEILGIRRFFSDLRKCVDQLRRFARRSRIPARANARANACEPSTSAQISFRSKCSEPEKVSKTSEGPASNLPPQSFICARLKSWPSLFRLARLAP